MTSPVDVPRVAFELTFDFERFHGEAELAARDAELWARAARQEILEGAVLVRCDDGAAPQRILDELAPLVQNLCFRGPAEIDAGPVDVIYFMRPGTLRLERDGSEVRLSGDHIEPVALPADVFLEALVACGERFVAFVRELKGEADPYWSQIAYMLPFRDKARAKLGS